MHNLRFWIAAGILGFVILISFFFSVPHTRDVALQKTVESHEAAILPRIALRDTYKKGVHTIVGTIEAPTACANVRAESALIGESSTTQSILVSISMPDDEGVCLKLPTSFSFSTMIDAPPSLPIVVTVNGKPASATPL